MKTERYAMRRDLRMTAEEWKKRQAYYNDWNQRFKFAQEVVGMEDFSFRKAHVFSKQHGPKIFERGDPDD